MVERSSQDVGFTTVFLPPGHPDNDFDRMMKREAEWDRHGFRARPDEPVEEGRPNPPWEQWQRDHHILRSTAFRDDNGLVRTYERALCPHCSGYEDSMDKCMVTRDCDPVEGIDILGLDTGEDVINELPIEIIWRIHDYGEDKGVWLQFGIPKEHA